MSEVIKENVTERCEVFYFFAACSTQDGKSYWFV